MKKDNVKKILLIMVINLIMSIIVFSITTYLEYKMYIRNVNNVILQIINKEEVDAIKILNEENPNYGKADLSKYGIKENNSVIKSMHETFIYQIVINIILIIFVNSITTIILVKIICRYNKKLENITEYVKEINNRNYGLNINDNDEGELSKLRNELYKIAITLKEENINISKQKMDLKKAISDISHQIKTPLTSINVLIDNIDNPNMDEKTRINFINELQSQITKIDSLIITLLKLARFDTNSILLKKENINIKKLFNDIVKELEILIEVKEIDIVIDVNKDISIIGDYKWELEALTNIIKNAIEYSDLGGKIYLSCETNSLFTKIIIKDEGKGIDEEDINHIFERFYKAKNASSNSFGIGLSLAKSIIEKDNGHIKVISELGQGTIFEIKFLK